MKNKNNVKVKKLGQIFTPQWCVKMLMDRAEYIGKNILNKKILEPSAGDGQIVLQIMQRLIDVCRTEGLDEKAIRKQLKNVYAIELDPEAYKKLKANSKALLIDNKITPFKMNFFNEDSLKKVFDFKFDFIIGNPPYVRSKNIKSEYKEYLKSEFETAKKNFDLYFMFYEKSIRDIKEDGVISFITPNYFLTKTGKEELLSHFIEKKLLKEIIEFDFLVFENARVFTSITVLKKSETTTKYISSSTNDLQIKWIKKLSSSSDFSDFNFKSTIKVDVKVEYDIKINRPDIFMDSELHFYDTKLRKFKGHKMEKDIIKPVKYKGKTHYYLDIKFVLDQKDWQKKYPYFNKYVKSLEITNLEKLINKTPETKERVLIAAFIYKDNLKKEISSKTHKQYTFRITSDKYSNEFLSNLIDDDELINFAKEQTQPNDNGSFKMRISTVKQYVNYKIEQYEMAQKAA